MAAKGAQDDYPAMAGSFTRHRMHHAPLTPSEQYLLAPVDPAGRVVDCSDRMLICASSNMRNEVVVGGADHALYSVNVADARSKHVTMYGKTMGHTDWVSTVTHLANGKVHLCLLAMNTLNGTRELFVCHVCLAGAVWGYGRQTLLVVGTDQISMCRTQKRLHSPHFQSYIRCAVQCGNVMQL
jgi:hypothetical protein